MDIVRFIKKNFLVGMACVLACFLIACKDDENGKKIGVIVPIEHKAMNEIVDGFKEAIQKEYNKPVQFKVSNAQGDMNLQRAIISQMKDQHFDIIAPIGTDVSQMAIATIKQRPILSIAALISEVERQKLSPCHVAIVHDEIPVKQLITFIHQVFPHIKNIALIHSTSDKIFPQVKQATQFAKSVGISIQSVMVPTLNELYSAVNNISDQSQAILVLKDHLIVSGIATLAHIAELRHIPLITSDQGSVQDGAGLALGVHEREIGVQAGKLAAKILTGNAACLLPIVEMKNLTVFINKRALEKENTEILPIEKVAKKFHYQIAYVTN